jgi:hypothetical protein
VPGEVTSISGQDPRKSTPRNVIKTINECAIAAWDTAPKKRIIDDAVVNDIAPANGSTLPWTTKAKRKWSNNNSPLAADGTSSPSPWTLRSGSPAVSAYPIPPPPIMNSSTAESLPLAKSDMLLSFLFLCVSNQEFGARSFPN